MATRLKDSRQATPFQIQNFLGHQNLSATERYLHELDVDRGVSAILDDSETAISDKIEPQIEPQKKAPPFLTGQTLFLLALFEPRRVAHGVVVNPAEDYPREDDPHNHRKAS